ncbi:MAG: hypothetical protein JNM84_11515 [Planctomycetes bacterium]|nr:hypothetical protein [Planctomycetota bacterium]
MELDRDQQKELASFSPELRALIEAELAAGNRIVALSHGFPAPPVGAYVMLERKVTTRPRAPGDGLDHRDRNSSLSSGEFTDAARIYFVVEPPDPPPPEPDMDAIRRAHAPQPDPAVALLQRRSGRVPPEWTRGAEEQARATSSTSPDSPASFAEVPFGCRATLRFRDARSPYEIRCTFERELRVLFEERSSGETLAWQAEAEVVGASYRFELSFEAAFWDTNDYELRVEVSWAGRGEANDEYYRKTSRSWIELWTREFDPATAPRADSGSPERYRALAEEARRAEAELDSIDAVQRAIVAGMQRGGRYANAHKEGGTNIVWRDGKYVRDDYGDYPGYEIYKSEAAFLAALLRFCDSDLKRNAGPGGLTELATWKLILRQMLTR